MRRARHQNVASVQDDWPIKKALTLSDVDITHPFLTLPRQPVENYILIHLTQLEQVQLQNREQVVLTAHDDDTGDTYIMKLKWCGSYYNLIGKWGRIVRSKGLNVGKEIRLRWIDQCLHFSVPQPQFITMQQSLNNISSTLQVHQDYWPIRKVLTLSDVDTTHPFLPLSHQSVEDHILVHWTEQQQQLLRSEEQVNLNARDVDTGDVYVMKLKWRDNYYNLIGKWGKIIRRKGLGVGKEIKIRWGNGCLNFSIPFEQSVIEALPVVEGGWPIKKALTLSDVDTNHPFLTLPGKAVEDQILIYWAPQTREQLRNDRQINLNARDDDTGELSLMKLKWRGSYYNLIGKWGQIIRGKGLQVGMEIRLRWDNGCLIFSVPQ